MNWNNRIKYTYTYIYSLKIIRENCKASVKIIKQSSIVNVLLWWPHALSQPETKVQTWGVHFLVHQPTRTCRWRYRHKKFLLYSVTFLSCLYMSHGGKSVKKIGLSPPLAHSSVFFFLQYFAFRWARNQI